MATQTLITGPEFDLLPLADERRCELVDGEIFDMPSANPQHQWIVMLLGAELSRGLEFGRKGAVVPDTEFAFGEGNRLRPDLAVLLASAWSQVDPEKVPVEVSPAIAVEVVSPYEFARVLERKTQIYLGAGVQEVWVIYPNTQHLYVHTTAEVRRLRASETLSTALIPNWSLLLGNLFTATK